MTSKAQQIRIILGSIILGIGLAASLASRRTAANDVGQLKATIREWDVPTKGAHPHDPAVGADGALWFTDLSTDTVGRITTGGTVTNEFAVLTPESEPWNIATGPDGALWFAETTGNAIGRVTTSGSMANTAGLGATECPIPTQASIPEGITGGPDGAVWFTEQEGNKIGRVTGVCRTEVSLSAGGCPPLGLCGVVAHVSEGDLRPPGVPVTFTITGANPQVDLRTTGTVSGLFTEPVAILTYAPSNAGTDHIVASFVDKSGRTLISNEVTNTSTAPSPLRPLPPVAKSGALAFKPPLPAPVLGKAVNAEAVSGVVLVKLPGGAHLSVATQHLSLAAKLLWAFESVSKGAGFVPLSEARQVPVGSTLDTTAGVARVTTATATSGKVQFGDFGAGIFTILQERKQHGLTNLNIVNTQSRRQACASSGKQARAAGNRPSSRVLALLKGRAHGKFTTRGQYSAATVRGTIWSVANRCDGTLTQVSRGAVSVRDFLRRKTITLGAGQRYLAEAP